MPLNTIVSYDGTANDDDAIALASVLTNVGAKPILAYVHHDTGSHTLGESDAQDLLDRGVDHFGATTETRIATNASTAQGLKDLTQSEHAQMIVFGSAYRTPAGRISPQKTTEKLFENGPVAVAIAPAGYRKQEINKIGLLAGLDDNAAIDTAHSLALAFGATVTDDTRNVDLLVVGSRPEAQDGHLLISARAEIAIEEADAPVLALARGVALSFAATTVAA